MKLILPADTTESTLVATNIPETDYAVWAAGTTYARGAFVISTTTHTVYRSLVDGNIGVNPDVEAVAFADPLIIDPATRRWQIFSATNRWRLFDKKPSVPATRADNIQVTLAPAQIVGGLAGFGIDAVSVEVVVESPGLLRRNLGQRSEDLANAYWTKAGTTIESAAIETDAVVLDKLVETTVNAEHYIRSNNIPATAGTYVQSMFYHESSDRDITLRPVHFGDTVATSQVTFFNATKTLGPISGRGIAATAEYIGEGLWRLSLTFTVTTAANIQLGAQMTNPGNSYLGDGTSGAFIGGMQLDFGSLTDYQWIVDAATWDKEVYRRVIPMQDNSVVVDWYTYFFEPIIPLTEFAFIDIPPYGDAEITVTISNPGGIAACGQLVVGSVRPIGLGTIAPGSGFNGYDFSFVEQDEFGNLTTIRRAATRVSQFEILVDNETLSGIDTLLRGLRGGTPAVWIGDDNPNKAALNYGFYLGYADRYLNNRESILTIQVQGIA
jgi:hypothetical protein